MFICHVLQCECNLRAYVSKCCIDLCVFSLLFGKVTGRAISLSQLQKGNGMSCSLWTSKTSRFAHQEPARLLQFPRVFYEIHPEMGKMRLGKISVKSLRRFRSDFDQASNCKLQGQSLGTVQTLYRRCRTSALEFTQFTEAKLVSKFAQGIKNLYLLCKGRAVGKGQVVAIWKCRSAFLFAGMFALLHHRRPILRGK